MQTSEYKRLIVNKLQVGDLINTRTESALGKAIRFFTQSNINHTAIYIGNDLVLEASFEVCIKHVNEYIMPDTHEIYCCSPKISQEIKNKLIKDAIPVWGAAIGYDVKGIFGLAFTFWIQKYWWRLTKLFRFDKNKLASSKSVWCSELAGKIYQTIKFEFKKDTDLSLLTPDEVYNSENCIKVN
jgi:cell wall-associated NlpC family hydrolase